MNSTPQRQSQDPTIVSRKELRYGIIILTCVATLMTGYAVHLNQIYYESYGPFFDSGSYLVNLFKVIEITQKDGILAGFQQVLSKGTTALPLLEAALIAPLVNHPTRELAPILHFPWLVALAISIFLYFLVFRRKAFLWSIGLTLPFLSISVFWSQNGGLSDFRMDLFHYLLLSTTFIWFLAARYTASYLPWILTGTFAGLTFLTRATSPVYAIFCLAPLILARLFSSQDQERKRVFWGAMLATFLAILASAWFYIVRFDFLYYYYVIWNLDANAKLPISESWEHVRFAFWNIGIYALITSLVVFSFSILNYLQRSPKVNPRELFQQLNWECLWLGVAPIALLVFRGAGPNPFVVMPAAFGILMFLLDPLKNINSYSDKPINKPSLIVLGVSSFLFLTSALQGIQNHSQPTLFPKLYPGPLFQSMEPQEMLIETTLNDIKRSNSESPATLGIIYLSNINAMSLENISKFNFLISSLPEGEQLLSQLQIYFSFQMASPASWEEVPGETDDEKIGTLVNEANRDLYYVIVPEDGSISNIGPKVPFAPANRHVGKIKSRLLGTGDWKAISDPIQVDFDEVVRLYRNESKFQF